jgi:AmiR/NasT family two-component response regulator
MNATPQVVVADDDPTIRDYLQEALTRLGWSVRSASSGRELVEACRRATPNLIVTDIRMPDMDGIEAASTICASTPVPVVLVSAHHDEETLGRLSGMSAVFGYLVKPISETHLKAAIALALTRFRQFEDLRREADGLRQVLEDRKVIERAKGVLTRRLGVSEEEAYQRLRKLASSKSLKLVEMGRQVIAAESVFTELDGI